VTLQLVPRGDRVTSTGDARVFLAPRPDDGAVPVLRITTATGQLEIALTAADVAALADDAAAIADMTPRELDGLLDAAAREVRDGWPVVAPLAGHAVLVT